MPLALRMRQDLDRASARRGSSDSRDSRIRRTVADDEGLEIAACLAEHRIDGERDQIRRGHRQENGEGRDGHGATAPWAASMASISARRSTSRRPSTAELIGGLMAAATGRPFVGRPLAAIGACRQAS